MSEPTKKQLLWGGGILAVFVGIAALLLLMRGDPPTEESRDQAPLVATEPVEIRSGVLSVAATGTVTPLAEIQLTPQVSGRVVWVNPALVSGGRVQAGERLIRIDPADYRNAVRQALADVAQQRVAVLEAEQEVELARAEFEAFQERERRRGADPGVQTQRSLVFKEPQLEAARAALERAQARLEDARLALDRTTVEAPFTAMIRSEDVDLGSYVAPGQTLATLVAAEGVEVVAPLTRAEAALIPGLWDAPATRIEARVYADYGGYSYVWDGYVHRAETVLDEATRTIDVVMRVPSPLVGGALVADPETGLDAGELRPGSHPPLLVGDFVTAHIDGPPLERYVVIPSRALRRGDAVWIVRDGRLRRVPVRVLRREDGRIAGLASDISGTDRVVVGELPVATEGMRVRTRATSTGAAPAGGMSTGAASTGTGSSPAVSTDTAPTGADSSTADSTTADSTTAAVSEGGGGGGA